ncbi:MAG: hypothetical protein AAGF99_01885 [Bacteroidota bacterium]
MGRLLLFLLVSTTLSTSVSFQRGAWTSYEEATERLSEHHAYLLAEEAATAGLVEARRHLDSHGAATTSLSGSHSGGTYRTDVVVQGSGAVAVRSEGTLVLPGDQGTARHVKEVSFAAGGTAPSGLPGMPAPAPTFASDTHLPDFMQGAVIAERTFSLHNGFRVEGNGGNANIRTNGSAQGSSAHVEGFLLHAQRINDAGIRNRLSNLFHPVENASNDPFLQQVSRVTIPNFNVQNLSRQATQVFNSNLHLNGAYTLGTADAPAIWYVNGDLSTHGPTTFSGYGIILVRRNVNLNHPVTNLDSGAANAHLALYGAQDVSINSTVTLHAQVFARSNVNFGGRSTVYGQVITRGTLNINGSNPRVVYQPAASAIVAPFWASMMMPMPAPAPSADALVFAPTRIREWNRPLERPAPGGGAASPVDCSSYEDGQRAPDACLLARLD